jgi:hypothetical protein
MIFTYDLCCLRLRRQELPVRLEQELPELVQLEPGLLAQARYGLPERYASPGPIAA